MLSLLLTCEDPITASSSKEILSFAFLTVDNPFLDEPVWGFVDKDSSTIYLTSALPLNDFPLVARFTTTGVAVKWYTNTVISGDPTLRYLPWPVLTVVAEDDTARNYTVEARQPPLDAFVANDGIGNRVYENDGSGTFTDSGQALRSSPSSGVALGNVHWR